MVKFFSVDWLVQSHRGAEPGSDPAPPCRPHVPCVVQPRPPTFGKGYLQPKPRPSKPVDRTEEGGGPPDSGPCSPSRAGSCASPGSEVSGYSSGYESEPASSGSPSADEGAREVPQRRVRTMFTPEQISKLEKIFNKHKYLDAGERTKTAHKLNLTETQVRTWFQNRRMKLKREVQDYLAPQVPPVMFQPLAPVQYHGVAAHRAHYPAGGPAFYPLPGPQMLLQPPMPHLQPPRVLVHNPHFY